MKYVWILTEEIEYQWTTYHFIHGDGVRCQSCIKVFGSGEEDEER